MSLVPPIGSLVRDRNGNLLKVVQIKGMSRMVVKSAITGDRYEGISIYEVDVVRQPPTPKPVTRTQPIERECEHCGAEGGAPCLTSGGALLPTSAPFHAVRRVLR